MIAGGRAPPASRPEALRALAGMNGTPPKRVRRDMRALGSVRAMDGEPAAHRDVRAAVPKARISRRALHHRGQTFLNGAG